MTDLRTRIAAALKAEAEKRGIYKIADFDFPFMADAVIRELRLGRRETLPAKIEPFIQPAAHRYVTEWVADE